MKVDLGAGASAKPGWVAVDVNRAHADVVADVTELPFRTGSVTELRAVDVLEHISYRYTDAALGEWARVCARGAKIYVQVPDAGRILHWWHHESHRLVERLPAELPQTPLAGLTWRLLGGHGDGTYADPAAGDDWRWNAHYALFTMLSLTQALDKAGFAVTAMPTNAHPNLCATARRRR